MSDSNITITDSCTVFSGSDAVELHRAMVLRSALKLLKHGISPGRMWTLTRALAACHRYTGQQYRRTQADRAIDDLTVWINTMASAIEVTKK